MDLFIQSKNSTDSFILIYNVIIFKYILENCPFYGTFFCWYTIKNIKVKKNKLQSICNIFCVWNIFTLQGTIVSIFD